MCVICRNEYEGITIINCYSCPKLVVIPYIDSLNCRNCYWLDNDQNPKGKARHEKVIRIQRAWRLTIFLTKYRRFLNDVLYLPEGWNEFGHPLGLLFPNGGYEYRMAIKDVY